MGFREYFGLVKREEAPEQPAPGSGVKPPLRDATIINANTATSLIPIYRAISLIQTGVAQLSLDTFREEIETGRVIQTRNPLIVRKPSADLSRGRFIKRCVAHLALTGNLIVLLDLNDRAEAINATILNAAACTIDEKGWLWYEGKKYPPERYRHQTLTETLDGTWGLGPIQAARAELQGAAEVRNYSSNFFNSGDTPSGVLVSQQAINDIQAQSIVDRWENREGHKVAVLGNGFSYERTLLSPKDAQFLETRNFNTQEIARLFGIPANLLLINVEGGSMTYSNMAQEDLKFVRWTLTQYTREIEEMFSSVVPRNSWVTFNMDGILRPDIKTRYEAHKTAIETGFLTIDEVRAIEGREPLPKVKEESNDE